MRGALTVPVQYGDPGESQLKTEAHKPHPSFAKSNAMFIRSACHLMRLVLFGSSTVNHLYLTVLWVTILVSLFMTECQSLSLALAMTEM